MKYNKNKEFSEIKKNPSQGKRISAVRRAENMVWTAAGVYDFEPQFLSFWQDGTPDFYTNSIIGYAHKWYFTTAMQTLFSTINDSLHRDLYDGLLWFVLENCTFEREVSARPALNEMRYSYAKKFLDQESSRSRQQWMAQNSTVYALQAARCHTILGQDTGLVSTKREKTFQRTYLKWFCNRSGDHPQGHFGFSTIFPLQWTAGQTYFSLSLFHASKEETSESLSFTYCPK